jgi:glutathione S-transferase
MTDLTLFHDWDSFQSFKVRLCLSDTPVRWESRIISIARFENLQPDYVRLNPLGVVPTLVAGSAIIPESSIINEFINDLAASGHLLPPDPAARAQARLWSRFEDDVVHPAVRLATFNLMIKQRVRRMAPEVFEALIAAHPWPARAAAYRKAATADIDDEQVTAAVRSFQAIVAKLDAALEEADWLAGGSYSLADIAMTPFADRVERLGMSCLWRDAPRVQNWIGRVRRRPNYALAVAPDDKRMPAPDADIVAAYLQKAASPIQPR